MHRSVSDTVPSFRRPSPTSAESHRRDRTTCATHATRVVWERRCQHTTPAEVGRTATTDDRRGPSQRRSAGQRSGGARRLGGGPVSSSARGGEARHTEGPERAFRSCKTGSAGGAASNVNEGAVTRLRVARYNRG